MRVLLAEDDELLGSGLKAGLQQQGFQIDWVRDGVAAERELLPMAEALGLAATLWSPLAGGFLTGKYRGGDDNNRASKLGMLVHAEKSARETALLDTLLAVAAEIDASPTHVAIAWLREKARRSTTALIPILGSRTREQLDATLGALEVQLSEQQMARLEDSSSVPAGVPHETIASAIMTAAKQLNQVGITAWMDPISNIRPLAPIFNAEPDRRDTGLLPAYSMLSREGKLTGHVSALALVSCCSFVVTSSRLKC